MGKKHFERRYGNVSVTDLISRQAAIAEISRFAGYLDDDMIMRIQIGLKRLPSAQPEQRWIPVSERLPDEEVLCCDTRGEMIIGYPYQDEESNTGYSAVLDDTVMIDCTAWMPLPEPYLEEGD